MSPSGKSFMAQHAGHRVESLGGVREMMPCDCPSHVFPIFRNDEVRVSSVWIKSHFHCGERESIRVRAEPWGRLGPFVPTSPVLAGHSLIPASWGRSQAGMSLQPPLPYLPPLLHVPPVGTAPLSTAELGQRGKQELGWKQGSKGQGAVGEIPRIRGKEAVVLGTEHQARARNRQRKG